MSRLDGLKQAQIVVTSLSCDNPFKFYEATLNLYGSPDTKPKTVQLRLNGKFDPLKT